MEATQYLRIALVFLSLVIFSRFSFGASKSSGFSIKLIPIDSSESPLYQPNLTHHERVERRVNITLAKAKLTNLRFTQNATFSDDKLMTALDRQFIFYIAYMMIGNPVHPVYIMVDTGSSLSWTQCEPCINCFQQSYPRYNSQASSSYHRVNCDHPLCNYNEPSSVFRCVNGDCVYSQTYGAGPTSSGPTKGYLSSESFHFINRNYGDEEFTVLFGCSNDNVNFYFGNQPSNRISGILGLDLDPTSLVSQLHETIGGVFSYCIVPYDQNYPFDVHPHILRFGDDVQLPEGNIPTTPFISFVGRNFYYLDLIDISVGRYRLYLPPGSFDATLGPGFFVDSGNPFTTLTTSSTSGLNVFELVTTAFSLHYDSYNLVRVVLHPTSNIKFSICYVLREGFTDYLPLTYHFQGADYVVHSRFVHMEFNEGFFCVALMPSPFASILGAYHMQNMRIIHNTVINAIQFYEEECASDHF
ncbi:aspartic proteinase CDR1-like [Pistacia vera]|uniref:aspartic proteinase CDR1-like n=1 Tax=Pistacia vera TaxID=55513 RepID=UPI0012630DF2|nr:aspartic proteinase CDR1-like [Pistacia vera]